MNRRALITGVTGQDGSYLAEFLLGRGYEVFGVVRRSSSVNSERVTHLADRITFVEADLLDQTSLINALRAEARQSEVYNLAAQLHLYLLSWDQPVLTAEFTALGVTSGCWKPYARLTGTCVSIISFQQQKCSVIHRCSRLQR